MQHDGNELNPSIVGANVAAARRRKSLNQTDLAKSIGVSRPILVAIESGQRVPSEALLVNLSNALDVRIKDLVMLPAIDESVLVRFRDPLRTEASATPAVNSLIDFGRCYRFLQSRSGKVSKSRLMPPTSLDQITNIEFAAADLAAAERARMSIGDAPISDLRALLEHDANILVFGLTSLQPKIAGLFTFFLDLALIGFNMVENDFRRQCWTLAHEYGHFLINRYDAEITYQSRKARDTNERFADRFAAHFLMPASGVSRRLAELTGGGARATVADVVLLADEFCVSFQAMCERLEEMERIPKGTYVYVMSRGFKPLQAERSVGIDRQNQVMAQYPLRFTYLLSHCWREGLISEGDVAIYLQTDRLSSRDILDRLQADPSYPIDAPLENAF